MTCVIDGCDRQAQYKARGICQMHYFRHMRTGQYDLPKKERKKVVTPNGYVRVYAKGHALANGSYVFEHRMVAYEEYGDQLPGCAMCGAKITWETCHIDHIDENRQNNSSENLRPLCNACNTRRSRKDEHEYDHCMGLTHNGETKSATEWAKDPRVFISAASIRRRKRAGMTDSQALFAPKETHKSWIHPDKAQIKEQEERVV